MSEAESNGKVHAFPERDRFRLRDVEFEMDAVEASTAFQEILTQLGESATQKTYLERIVAWVEEQGGPKLSLGEAEWFYHYVEQIREEKRVFFRERLAATRTSPHSMG